MDGQEGLQLLPGTKKRLGIKIPGENRFLYIGSAILGAAIVTALWFNFNIKALENNIATLDSQILELEQKRNKKSESNIVLTQRQLALTGKLIDEHLYFSQAIAGISSLIQEKIQIERLSIEPDGKVNLAGAAVSYTVIARQMAVFLADNSVTDMTMGRMSSRPDGMIEFNMDMVFDKAKLLQKKK